jgi:uncharacterized repeat protein (TIGR01451 family)
MKTWWKLSAAAVLVATALIAPAASVGAADNVTVTLDFSRFLAIEDPDPTQGDGDYEARVSLDGGPTLVGSEISGVDFDPSWNFQWTVDRETRGTSVITVRVEDNDGVGAEPDDIMDLNAWDQNWDIEIAVDLFTGDWSLDGVSGNIGFAEGDGDTEYFGSTAGGEAGRVEFSVSVSPTGLDSDGDGLLDAWESGGYDADGDGNIDVDLPAMGADPNRADLFLELDFGNGATLTRPDIQAMKAAFAAAPYANPDGSSGINLWVDTGTIVDPNAREDGTVDCANGVDDDGDGLADGADPDCVIDNTRTAYLDGSHEGAGDCSNGLDDDGDSAIDGGDAGCLVGDNLGGGGDAIASLGACELDAAFYAAKAANFDPDRSNVFRYAISSVLPSGCDGTGGQGEIGGNDFIDFNQDAGTVLHELGHNLELRHGGDVNTNCKPNYVSGMNYDQQFGILRSGGGAIVDYAPPRRAITGATRGSIPGSLSESSLDETALVDATDASNLLIFFDVTNDTKVFNRMDQPVDWNGDGDTNDTSVSSNPNSAASDGGPRACRNSPTGQTLGAHNDWANVALSFRQFGDSANSAINPETEDVPTRDELEQLLTEVTSADLGVTIDDDTDPAVAGTSVEYVVEVSNDGPASAEAPVVEMILPSGLALGAGSSASCTDVGNVVCALDPLASGSSTSVAVVADIAADLVYDNGGPLTVTTTVSVTNSAGPDPDPADNLASETTQIVAQADLAVDGVTPVDPPSELIAGEATDVTVRIDVSSGGPSSPMDTLVTASASAPPGGSTSGSPTVVAVDALEVGEPQSREVTFSITCLEPGFHTLQFSSSIAPASAADSDPNPFNNSAQATIEIDCVIPVAINVHPGSYPNSVRTNSTITPIAVLTTDVGEYGLPLPVDASTIEPANVIFGPEAAIAAGGPGAPPRDDRLRLEDSRELVVPEVIQDGDLDAIFHFRTRLAGLDPTDSVGCVRGELVIAGETFRFLGCDEVRVI